MGVGEVGGCNNDVLRSVSADGGSTFTGTTTPPDELEAVSHDGSVPTDQWWQWSAENPQTGKVVAVFYDRQYGDCQATGCMDITLRRSNGSFVRVTNDSMPPSNEFPDVNGFSTFMGDYTGSGDRKRRDRTSGLDGLAEPDLRVRPSGHRSSRAGLRWVWGRHLHRIHQGQVELRSREGATPDEGPATWSLVRWEVYTSYAQVSTRSVSLLVPSCSRPQVLPALTEQDRIVSYPKTQMFAELLIDCKEDRRLRAVLVGMLREGGKVRRGSWEMGGSASMGSRPPRHASIACGRPKRACPGALRRRSPGERTRHAGCARSRFRSQQASLLVSLLQHAVARCSVDVDR